MCPEGTFVNSPAINRGAVHKMNCKSRRDGRDCRPAGTCNFCSIFPTINRGAINNSSYGAKRRQYF